jgi:hypothetical protein
MKQRQYGENAIIGGHIVHGLAVLGTAQQGVLGQHCSLWTAGCAGGVQDENGLARSVFDFGRERAFTVLISAVSGLL